MEIYPLVYCNISTNCSCIWLWNIFPNAVSISKIQHTQHHEYFDRLDYKLDKISNAIEKACFDEKYRNWVRELENPYGDGTAAQKILESIESVDLQDSKWYVKKKLCP